MEQVVSKQVADREAIARSLKTSIEEHAPQMVDLLAAALFPDGVPDDVNLAKFIAAVGDYFDRSTQDMHDKDVTLAAEKADDPAKFRARDQAVADVRDELFGCRSLLDGTYGRGTATAYGLRGDTPEQPDLLRNRGEAVAKVLKSQPLPPPRPRRSPLDAADMAEAIEALLATMSVAMKAVGKEERELQLALSARDQAVDAWARAYRGVAGMIASAFWLVGLDDLHDRVRPTAKRRVGIPEDEDVEE